MTFMTKALVIFHGAKKFFNIRIKANEFADWFDVVYLESLGRKKAMADITHILTSAHLG
jgi:hypothetical protein